MKHEYSKVPGFVCKSILNWAPVITLVCIEAAE